MSKVQILDKANKVIPTKIPTPAPVDAASNALIRLIETHHEYKKIAAQEKTKRQAIEAWKDVRLTELNNQKERGCIRLAVMLPCKNEDNKL